MEHMTLYRASVFTLQQNRCRGINLLVSSRFGEGLRMVQEKLDSKNFYAFNPAFDNAKNCGVNR